MTNRYLVTGGAGFIGSNIVEELLRYGKKVRVLDNLSTGREENLKPFKGKIDFIKGDIRNKADVEKAVRDMDFVIHQAALRSVPLSMEEPLETNDVNVNGTMNVLMCAKTADIKRLVYASSSSTYGNCNVYPQKESFVPDPMSPYAVSKLTGEYYCRAFSKTMGIETVSLRYFNVFGPRQNPRSKYAAVIPTFIMRLMSNQPCIIDGSGNQSRDFTFVSNVVDANLAACEMPGISGETFNVAGGENHSVINLAEELKRLLGKDIESIHGPKRTGDIEKSFADISKLREILGAKPRVNFKEGLKRTVEWFQSAVL